MRKWLKYGAIIVAGAILLLWLFCLPKDLFEGVPYSTVVTDKNGERPARYGDFCILLRSTSSHAAAYVDELVRQGIPAFTEKSGGFFAKVFR